MKLVKVIVLVAIAAIGYHYWNKRTVQYGAMVDGIYSSSMIGQQDNQTHGAPGQNI